VNGGSRDVLHRITTRARIGFGAMRPPGPACGGRRPIVHLEENLAAGGLALDDEDLAALREV
jgi:hypothetical protein